VVELGTGLGNIYDPDEIRTFVQGIEALGYGYVTMGDHVLGADPARYNFVGPFTWREMSHEPLICYAFVAALTTNLGLSTSFVVLPARQTVLAAKQATELDILSKGRLRLGVGLGAGENEYEWGGQDFHTRGARLAAQVRLMRRLWSQELVIDYEDRWERITAGGLNPRPPRQIPVWFGGMDERMLRRTARLADGWIPHFERKDGELFEAVTLGDVVDRSGRYTTGAPAADVVERIRGYVREAGRDPALLQIQATCPLSGNLGDDVYWAGKWQELGAEHISCGYTRGTVAERLEYLAQFKAAWDGRG
jgi:probable F420-dependent oxidoreductase